MKRTIRFIMAISVITLTVLCAFKDPETLSNQYDYVDLGLPSGTLWATCNIGANVPEKYGDYFAWAETKPKSTYTWDTYKHCRSNGDNDRISSYGMTKYCDDDVFGFEGFEDDHLILDPTDDAATVNWGEGWRMPTEEEWQELYETIAPFWTEKNGVKGVLFTAQNGNELFLPASGIIVDSEIQLLDSVGGYNSNILISYRGSRVNAFVFGVVDGFKHGMDYVPRFAGVPVRPVRIIDDQGVFIKVEESPEFPGGSSKLAEFLQRRIKYPILAREAEIQGRVYVAFIVEPDGSLSDFKVVRGIGGGCDEEALRVLKGMPNWMPGKQGGKAVRVRHTVPVTFKLK